jgi:hypothetical protein
MSQLTCWHAVLLRSCASAGPVIRKHQLHIAVAAHRSQQWSAGGGNDVNLDSQEVCFICFYLPYDYCCLCSTYMYVRYSIMWNKELCKCLSLDGRA